MINAVSKLINGKRTVDGVLAAFKKTVDDLGTVAQEQTNEAELQAQNARNALALESAARNEAARAVKAVAKLEAVFVV